MSTQATDQAIPWGPAQEAEGYADCAQAWLEYQEHPKGKKQGPLTLDQAFEFAQANALLAIRAELRHLADVIGESQR